MQQIQPEGSIQGVCVHKKIINKYNHNETGIWLAQIPLFMGTTPTVILITRI